MLDTNTLFQMGPYEQILVKSVSKCKCFLDKNASAYIVRNIANIFFSS